MLVISREQTESYVTCVLQLEEGEPYNQNAMINVCSHPSIPRHASSSCNIPEHKGRYEVSIQIGHDASLADFAAECKKYGSE
jgi:hypothetical protein